MSEKRLSTSSNQGILNHIRKAPLPHVVFLDVLGIILVLVGALYTHYHEGSSAGEIVFWVGFVPPNCCSDTTCVELWKTEHGKGLMEF